MDIKPRKIPWVDIRNQAEAFRQKYVNPVDQVPIPIEEIIEFKLSLEIQPIEGLSSQIDVDGFLANDLQTIFVDKKIYLDERYYRRLRFTYAHEIGHLILHKNEISNCHFRSETDWLQFRRDMSEDDLFWFEQQAYEFAGRLLVPKDQLIKSIENQRENIIKYRELSEFPDDDMLIRALSRIICDFFQVSEQVVHKRISAEKIWKDLKI